MHSIKSFRLSNGAFVPPADPGDSDTAVALHDPQTGQSLVIIGVKDGFAHELDTDKVPYLHGYLIRKNGENIMSEYEEENKLIPRYENIASIVYDKVFYPEALRKAGYDPYPTECLPPAEYKEEHLALIADRLSKSPWYFFATTENRSYSFVRIHKPAITDALQFVRHVWCGDDFYLLNKEAFESGNKEDIELIANFCVHSTDSDGATVLRFKTGIGNDVKLRCYPISMCSDLDALRIASRVKRPDGTCDLKRPTPEEGEKPATLGWAKSWYRETVVQKDAEILGNEFYQFCVYRIDQNGKVIESAADDIAREYPNLTKQELLDAAFEDAEVINLLEEENVDKWRQLIPNAVYYDPKTGKELGSEEQESEFYFYWKKEKTPDFDAPAPEDGYVLAQVPFPGFSGTLLGALLDFAIDYEESIRERNGDAPMREFYEEAYAPADAAGVEWLNAISKILRPQHKVLYAGIHSPKEYNWKNDTLWAYFHLDDLKAIVESCDKELLDNEVKEATTHYDGYFPLHRVKEATWEKDMPACLWELAMAAALKTRGIKHLGVVQSEYFNQDVVSENITWVERKR